MPELISSHRVKARKMHPCRTCNEPAVIPGQEYIRDVYVYDGSAYAWLQCEPCRAMATAVFDWSWDYDEGIGPNDYFEWAKEHQNDDKQGETARAYLARLKSTR